MEHKYSTTTQGGIQIHPSHILIPGSNKLGTVNQTIREQTLASYMEFLGHWEVAMAQCYSDPSVSFVSLWVHNSVFRDELTQALAAIGLERPEALKPVQLSELVLTCRTDSDEGTGDIRGAVFRLHQDTPDPKALAQTQEDETEPPNSPTFNPWSTLRRWF